MTWEWPIFHTFLKKVAIHANTFRAKSQKSKKRIVMSVAEVEGDGAKSDVQMR